MPLDHDERDRIRTPKAEEENAIKQARNGALAMDYNERDRITDEDQYKGALQKANFDRLAREEVAQQSLPEVIGRQIGGGQSHMVEGPFARVTDFLRITEGKADTLNRLQDARQGAATQRHEEIPYINERITKGAVGTASQLPMVLATGSMAGTPAIIGLFTANVASESYTRARDAGLSVEEAKEHADRMAMVEGGITAAFSVFGLGGMEQLAGGWLAGNVAKQHVGKAIREKLAHFVAHDLAPEFVEELTIEALQNVILAADGVDPNAADFDQQFDSMIDVAIQTAMMTSASKAVRSGIDYMGGDQNSARRTSEIEYLSEEDIAEIEAERQAAQQRKNADPQDPDAQAPPTQDPSDPQQPPGGPVPPVQPQQPPGGPEAKTGPDIKNDYGDVDEFLHPSEIAKELADVNRRIKENTGKGKVLDADLLLRKRELEDLLKRANVPTGSVDGADQTSPPTVDADGWRRTDDNTQPGVPGVDPGVQPGEQTDGTNQREGVISDEGSNEVDVRDQGRQEEGDEGQVAPTTPNLPPTAAPPGSDPNAPGGADASTDNVSVADRQELDRLNREEQRIREQIRKLPQSDPQLGPLLGELNKVRDAKIEILERQAEELESGQQSTDNVSVTPDTEPGTRRLGDPNRFKKEDQDLADSLLNDVLRERGEPGLPTQSAPKSTKFYRAEEPGGKPFQEGNVNTGNYWFDSPEAVKDFISKQASPEKWKAYEADVTDQELRGAIEDANIRGKGAYILPPSVRQKMREMQDGEPGLPTQSDETQAESQPKVNVKQIFKNAVRFSVDSDIPADVPQTRGKRTDGVEYIEVANPHLDRIPGAREAIERRRAEAAEQPGTRRLGQPKEEATDKPTDKVSVLPEGAIGLNRDGKPVMVDSHGVRSVDGVQEKVELRPTRTPEGKITYVPQRMELEDRFKTVEELEAESKPAGAAPSTDNVSAVEQVKAAARKALESRPNTFGAVSVPIPELRSNVGKSLSDDQFIEAIMQMERDALLDLTVHPDSSQMGKDDIRRKMPFGSGFADVATINPKKIAADTDAAPSTDKMSVKARRALAAEIEKRVDAGDFRQEDIDAIRAVTREIHAEVSSIVDAWHEKHDIPLDRKYTRPGYLESMVKDSPSELIVDMLEERLDRHKKGHKNAPAKLIQRSFKGLLDKMDFSVDGYRPIQDPKTPGTAEKRDSQDRRVTNIETTDDGFEIGLTYTKGMAINERVDQPDGTVKLVEKGRRGEVPNYWIARKPLERGEVIEIGDTREEALDKARTREAASERFVDDLRNKRYSRDELQEIADAKGRGWLLRMIAGERGIEGHKTRRFDSIIRDILEQQKESAEKAEESTDNVSVDEATDFESLPEAIPAYVISGMQRGPGDISAQKVSGRPIGIAVGPARVSDRVMELAGQHANRGNTVFVDSGMFGVVSKGEPGAKPDYDNVFVEYGRLIEATNEANRRNLMFVLPDYLVKGDDGMIRGGQSETLDLQAKYARQSEELMDRGAKVIIPLQRGYGDGAMGLGEVASLASDNLDLSSGNFAWGIPYNAAAWEYSEILDVVRAQKKAFPKGSGMHLHLLGGGKARAEKLWDQVKAIDPTVTITGDAATEVRNRNRFKQEDQDLADSLLNEVLQEKGIEPEKKAKKPRRLGEGKKKAEADAAVEILPAGVTSTGKDQYKYGDIPITKDGPIYSAQLTESQSVGARTLPSLIARIDAAGFKPAATPASTDNVSVGPQAAEPKPKTKIQQAKEAQNTKFKEAGQRLLDEIRRSRSEPTMGVSPMLLKLSIEFAVEGVKDGAVNFAAFVENAYNSFGEAINELIPYLELGWDALHRRDLVKEPAGYAQEIVDRLRNQEQGQDDGQQVLSEGDSGDQAAGDRLGVDSQEPGRPDVAGTLEGVQPGDGRSTEGSRDTDGVRDGDPGGVPGGRDGTVEQLGNDDVRSGADVRGDAPAGQGGTGTDGRPGDGQPGDGRGIDQAPKSSRPNFHLTDPDRIIGKGLKDKFARNRQALELSEDLERTGRAPTQEELEILASYIGWGAFGQELFQGNWDNPRVKKEWEAENEWLREHLGEDEWRSAQESIPNAHYTDPEVVTGIWSMLRRMGFKGGRFLEPSFGVGNFAALMPRDLMAHTNFTAIELDKATARIAKILYPQINVQQKGYQQSKTPDDFYDVSSTNVPFGNYKISDKRYRQDYSIHNYFFRKDIDQLKPGGIMAFVTSNMTMDGKEQARLLRLQLADRADLVAAYRFPTGAFEKYAKTKVVADLIILRKRKPGETPSPLNEEWIDIVSVDTPSGQKVDVNKYWTLHPDHIMGTLDHGTGTTSGRPGMIVHKPTDLAERWQKIVESVPENILNTDRAPSEGKERANEKKLRQNTVLSRDNELYIAKGEQLLPLKDYVSWYRANSKQATIDKKRKEIESLLKVRDVVEQVLEVQGKGEDASALRKELNRVYDEFVSQYGYISKSEAMKHLAKSRDAIAHAVKALETKMPDGTYDKRPIFTKSTVRQPPRVGEKLSVVDAFALARNNSVDIDWDAVADSAQTPKAEVLAELESKEMIYKVGEDLYDAADVFLSGNMARKIRQIEAAMAEGVPGLEKSLEAAKKVTPEPLSYSQIQVRLGAPWIPASDYSQFIADLLQETPDRTSMVRGVRGWKAEFAPGVNNAPAVVQHGHNDVPFSRLVVAAINNGRVKVYYRDAQNNQVFDEQATIEANAKIDELREKFADWIWQTPDRIARLAKAYNEDFRSTVTPNWKEIQVPLLFEGLALEKGTDAFSLRSHQVAAVWRAIISGKGLFAHEVGTGKTLTMGAIALESRRLRLANKPVLLAHNANSRAVYSEIQAAYPGAKILYVDNLDPKRKDETMASIATEDWDLVVVPHSLADKFTMRPETLERLLRQQMDELEAAALEAYAEDESTFKGVMPTDLDNIDKEDMRRLRSRTAKELVKERYKLREKIVKAYENADSEKSIFVEDMGVDMVMVDEAHIFKKLPIASRQQVKGLNKKASQPGSMLMLLSDYVRETQNGRGVYLFTGTPVTNTLNEIYNMQRFIMPDEMQAVGVKDWDGWFNTFATAEAADELSAGGTYETFERLTSFVNLPELREMIGQYMDTVFADQMEEFVPRETRDGRVEEGEKIVGRPYKKVHNETLPMSDLQKSVSKDLADRYREVKNATGRRKMELLRTREYMPLVISGEGVKMALDPRLIDGVDPTSIDPRDPRLKINRMITNAMDHYYEHDKSTQMIFMQIGHEETADRVTGRDNDGNPIYTRVQVFNLAKEIKRRLIEEGVPESEIALFSGMDKEKRTEAALAMNRGEIRFAIGGTETMGTGINAQENLRAMHHLDAPWMPGDLEQRNGRGQRQGNRWNTVHEYRYLTESPQDGRRWQVLLTKDRFIQRFMRSKGDERIIDMSDVDLDEDGGGDMEATFSAAVGDPRIQQRFKLEREVTKLERAKERHRQTINNTQREARYQLRDLSLFQDQLAELEAANKAYEDSRPEAGAKPKMTTFAKDGSVSGTIEGSEAIDDLLKQVHERYLASQFAPGTYVPVGEYRGNKIEVTSAGDLRVGTMRISFKDSYTSLEGTLRNLVKRIENGKGKIAKIEQFVKSADEAAKLPFVRQPQLDAKKKRLAALIAEMEANPMGSPSWFRNAAPIGSTFYLRKRKRAEGRQAFADMESEDFREAITGEPSAQNVREELEEHAVTGFRSDTHIFYEADGEMVPVPADQVLDESGMPIFEQLDEVRNAHDAGQLPPNTSAFVTKVGAKIGDAVKRRLGGRRGGPGQPPGPAGTTPTDTAPTDNVSVPDSTDNVSVESTPGDQEGEPIRQADVVTTWRRLFNVPIRQGGFRWRLGGGGVKHGIYKWLDDVIRLREGQAYDMIVAAHEIGHHLDKRLKLYNRNEKESRLRDLLATDKKRYYKVFGQLQALDYEPNGKRIAEGIAEAVRFIITGTSVQDARVAPDAIDWVREQINNDATYRDAMSQAIEHARKYAGQGALQRARSVFGGPPVDLDKRERLRQDILSISERQYINFVDQKYVLKKFSDAIVAKGKIEKGQATLYEVATAFDGTVGARVARSVTDGVYSVVTNQRMGPSLTEATDHLQGQEDLQDAMTYAVAVHGLQQAEDYNFGMDRQDAQEFVDWVRSDPEKVERYDNFHKKLTEYNNALLLMVAETGRITPAEVHRMLDAHGETYVPLLREMDDQRIKKRLGSGGSDFIELPPAFRRRTKQGSGRPVKNLLESSIELAMHRTNQALSQEVHNTMVAQADPYAVGPDGRTGAEDLGHWLERLPPGTTVHTTEVKAILKELVEKGFFTQGQADAMRIASEYRMGIAPSDDDVIRLRRHYKMDKGLSLGEARAAVEMRLDAEPDITETVSFYTPDYRRPDGKYVIKVMRGGKPQLYAVDPQLYEAATMLPQEARGAFVKFLDFYVRQFKVGTVGVNTAFLVGNLTSDAATFSINTKHVHGKDRLTKPMEWAAKYAAAVTAGKPNEIVHLFREYGGELYNMIGVDSRRLPTTIRRMVDGSKTEQFKKAVENKSVKQGMLAITEGVEQLADHVRSVNAFSDVGPRLAEMEGVFKDFGYILKDGRLFHEKKGKFETPPRDIVIKAMFAAGDVTYNYRRRGRYTQNLERAIPFSNAAIQSVDKTIRVYRDTIEGLGSSEEDQRKWAKATMITMGVMSALILALKLANRDNEDEQEEWLRAGYVQYRLPNGKIVRLRISREHNWLPALLSAGVNQAMGDDQAMGRALRHQGAERVPMFSGAGPLGVAVEQAMNYKTFFDTEIEPDYIEGVPRDSLSPAYRYDDRTLWSSKAIGSVTGKAGLGPMRVEHAADGLSGGRYSRWMRTVENAITGSLDARDIPFVRGVYYDDTRRSVSKSRFYEEMSKADREVNDQLKAGGKHNEGTLSALTRRQSMSETAQAMRLLRDHRGDDYDPTQNEVALARQAIGRPESANYPDPYTTEIPPEVRTALKKKAVNDLGEIARGLGRPRRKQDQDESDYQQELSVWEAKRAGTMQFYADRQGSPIVDAAIAEVLGSKAFSDLLMGKGAPTPKSQDYPEEMRRFGQRRQEALKFLQSGVGE